MRRHHSRWMAVGLGAAVLLSLVSLAAGPASSAPLRYTPKLKQIVAYEVEITADMDWQTRAYKGTIWYEATSIDDAIKLTCNGGLAPSFKQKKDSNEERDRIRTSRLLQSLADEAFFGHSFGRGYRLTISSRGEVRQIQGRFQLPYLLGNVSMLMFEPLPEKEEKTWNVTHPISLWDSIDSPYPRLPGLLSDDHWGRDRATAGEATTSFTLQKAQGDLATFQRTYRLHSASDDEVVTLESKGVWTFNQSLGMSESLDSTGQLVLKDKNITVTIPLTVKYRRLSEEERLKLEKERKAMDEKFRKEAEEKQKQREAPLDPKQREKALADLKSGDMMTMLNAIGLLAEKENVVPDKEIAQALEQFLTDKNHMMRHRAEEAMEHFWPEYAQRREVNKAYSEGSPLNQIGAAVTDDTPLPAGLIVAAKWHGDWHAARIVRVLPDGLVDVEIVKWNQIERQHRSQLRLAPPEVGQPYVTPFATPGAGDTATGESDRDYRTWTDDSGTFTVVAKFVGADQTHATIARKSDGKEIKVPLARLNQRDRKIAEQLRDAPKPSNPFDP